MVDNNCTLCVHYFHPKASLIMWVEHFIHHCKLALTRVGNLTCYLLEHKLIKRSLLVGSEGNHHLFTLLRRLEKSIVQCNIDLFSPGAPKLLTVDEPQTPVNFILLLVMTAGAYPDPPGPLRHEVAEAGWRSFWWPNVSMKTGTAHLRQPYGQGPGLAAAFSFFLNHF